MSSADSASRDYLVLDASTREIRVGVASVNGWQAHTRASGDALETLFRLTDETLKKSGRTLPELAGVLFCAGPGRLLGLRLAAMAVSTWSFLRELDHWKVRQYRSLDYVAATRQLAGETDFHVLSPFRRDQFNHLPVVKGETGEFGVLPLEEVAQLEGPRYLVPNGTQRSPAPNEVLTVDYDLGALPEVLQHYPARFHPVRQPDVHVPVSPTFARWSAERHRASNGDT